MQQSLLILLVLAIILAVLGFYFGFIRPPKVMAWLQQSAFVIMAFLIIPFIIFTLNSQTQAPDRLASTGFKPHPAIVESVGIASGISNNPTWVFEIDANKDQVRNFYLSEENTGDWELSTDADIMLIFKKDDLTMTIGFNEGRTSNTLTFMQSRRKS